MSAHRIPPALFDFLTDLRHNNNREWFNTHKERYQTVHEQFKAFAADLLDAMSHHDEIEKMRTHRIYRDIRFSKDKTPYKQHFSGGLKRATKWRRGGYYFHVEPGNSFAGGGFWGPNSADLKRIRVEIAADDRPLRKILTSAAFKKHFGQLEGDTLKTAPQGFAKDHPAVDLLRYKQFLLIHRFSDQEVLAAKFGQQLNKTFRAMRPFFDYMSDVLTTDENGVPIE